MTDCEPKKSCKRPKHPCRRTIMWHGKVQEIVVDYHAYGWSGRIPCTGVRRCIYCGRTEDENQEEDQKQ